MRRQRESSGEIRSTTMVAAGNVRHVDNHHVDAHYVVFNDLDDGNDDRQRTTDGE